MDEPEKILRFLRKNFAGDATDVRALNDGERSRAFRFTAAGSDFVFRINRNSAGFLKDAYAFRHFSGRIPVPEILKTGPFGNGYFAISPCCKGTPLENGTRALSTKLMHNLSGILDCLRAIPLPDGKYGVADSNGIAAYDSWEQWVAKDHTPVTREDGSFVSLDEAKRVRFADARLMDALLGNCRRLVHFVPVDRHVIHGDFGPGNIIIDGDTVTGVIDWNEFGYGDFLYDVAWLDFWFPGSGFSGVYRSIHPDIPEYAERISCHKTLIGFNTLGIYAAIGWKEGYDSTVRKIRMFFRDPQDER